jgi:hypothetical protein
LKPAGIHKLLVLRDDNLGEIVANWCDCRGGVPGLSLLAPIAPSNVIESVTNQAELIPRPCARPAIWTELSLGSHVYR